VSLLITFLASVTKPPEGSRWKDKCQWAFNSLVICHNYIKRNFGCRFGTKNIVFFICFVRSEIIKPVAVKNSCTNATTTEFAIFLFIIVIYVFLLSCLFMYLHRANWNSSAPLTEVFPCFFLSCNANARVNPAKTGHGPHSSKIFVLFYVLFILCRSVHCLCDCLLYYCHRVATQLQLTNISYLSIIYIIYHIVSYHQI